MTTVADKDPRQISREATVFLAVRDRDPEGEFWRQVVDAEVLAAIDELPEEFREAVVLSDLEDMSHQEASEILDVPVGTVKSRLSRGRRILQKRLFEYAAEQGIVETRVSDDATGVEGGPE